MRSVPPIPDSIKPKIFWNDMVKITGNIPIASIVDAEPIGPQKLLDLLIIAPCTGNTLAKLCNGVTNTPVLMAAKAHLRNDSPVLIALSTNDGLSANAKNIGELIARKNIYFAPFARDNYINKNSRWWLILICLWTPRRRLCKANSFSPCLKECEVYERDSWLG